MYLNYNKLNDNNYNNIIKLHLSFRQALGLGGGGLGPFFLGLNLRSDCLLLTHNVTALTLDYFECTYFCLKQ